ncbi:MAG: hypothetical protein JNM24_01065 [Bdellovibrionaceae bacterium]|nr:hypothetical protein [Pseudobdellovibrionaceae bacterium]
MMNRYFILSFLSLGLMFGLFIIYPVEARLKGLPIWMHMMILFTLGIFFLIFGIKQKMFLDSKGKP